MFGYMTRKEAKELGYEYAGTYYSVPIYAVMDGEDIRVVARWEPCEILLPLFCEIEMFIKHMVWPHDEHYFDFMLEEEKL